MSTTPPSVTAPARLWLVRHGQTDWNVQRRIQGHTPTPLNEAGVHQAHLLAAFFARRRFAAIWASDLPRAAQTAAIIGEKLSRPVQTTEQLRERELGEFQGKTWDEIRQMRGIEPGSPLANGDLSDWTGIPGVETDTALWHRIRRVLVKISADYPGQDVLVVTHGGVVKHSVWHVLGLPAGAPRRFPLANGITVILQQRGESFYLLSMLDIAILDGHASAVDTASASGIPSA